MTDSIDDRLKKVNTDLDELLSGLSIEFESNLQMLIRFGLSSKEARTWLSKEPNYSRRKVTDSQWKDKTDGDVTEPERPLFLIKHKVSVKKPKWVCLRKRAMKTCFLEFAIN